MKKTLLIIALVSISGGIFAQKKTTTSATVTFDATTSLDALPKASNKTVVAALDTKTGTVAFEAGVKNFAFSNPTMQEHFNSDKWLDSDKFPSFTFKGNIVNLAAVDFTKDGSYNADVEGTLNIKGVEKKIKAPATIVVKSGAVSTTSKFTINVADYGITGVPIDAGKVAKEPKITVSADFK